MTSHSVCEVPRIIVRLKKIIKTIIYDISCVTKFLVLIGDKCFISEKTLISPPWQCDKAINASEYYTPPDALGFDFSDFVPGTIKFTNSPKYQK